MKVCCHTKFYGPTSNDFCVILIHKFLRLYVGIIMWGD